MAIALPTPGRRWIRWPRDIVRSAVPPCAGEFGGRTKPLGERLAVLHAVLATEHDETGPSARRGDLPMDDLACFDSFFQRYEHDILGYLWRMTGDEQAALDLTQETFVRAWQRFAAIQDYDQPRAWLFRVATHLALNHLRQRSVRLHALLPFHGRPDARPATAVAPTDAALTTPDHAPDIAEREAVRQTLRSLPARERAALVLHSVYGLSCAEIATTLGTSLGAAKNLLWRGRERFRAQYLREEESR